LRAWVREIALALQQVDAQEGRDRAPQRGGGELRQAPEENALALPVGEAVEDGGGQRLGGDPRSPRVVLEDEVAAPPVADQVPRAAEPVRSGYFFFGRDPDSGQRSSWPLQRTSTLDAR